MPTQVKITNTYADRSNTVEVTVSDPEDFTPDGLEDWWQDTVFPHTGDGRGGYSSVDVVVTKSDIPELTGETYGWDG